MKNLTQESQVIEAIRAAGGYATSRRLNEMLDFSTWKTHTPEASVRRIVQNSKAIFRIRPGLWALEECRKNVLAKFELKTGNAQSEERFTHAYYQGLLVEIGKYRNQRTYVPAQDKNRLFIGQPLGNVSDTVEMPPFTYESLLKRARTIVVIWFNERAMPSAFYEVEHTTDIKNSLSKFFELQDFYAGFYIVADKHRHKEYEDKLRTSMFAPLINRISFINYEQVVGLHEGLTKIKATSW
jgi:hypothetical protein